MNESHIYGYESTVGGTYKGKDIACVKFIDVSLCMCTMAEPGKNHERRDKHDRNLMIYTIKKYRFN